MPTRRTLGRLSPGLDARARLARLDEERDRIYRAFPDLRREPTRDRRARWIRTGPSAPPMRLLGRFTCS